jgi:hypothetical protein
MLQDGEGWHHYFISPSSRILEMEDTLAFVDTSLILSHSQPCMKVVLPVCHLSIQPNLYLLPPAPYRITQMCGVYHFG